METIRSTFFTVNSISQNNMKNYVYGDENTSAFFGGGGRRIFKFLICFSISVCQVKSLELRILGDGNICYNLRPVFPR